MRKTSYQIFVDFMKEYYQHEFLELSKEFKDHWIEEILSNNAKYITKEDVVGFDACNRCGRCCEAQGCLDYDEETKLCTRHDNPIHELCHTYPWAGDLGISPLWLDCRYQKVFFVNFFNGFFASCLERGV